MIAYHIDRVNRKRDPEKGLLFMPGQRMKDCLLTLTLVALILVAPGAVLSASLPNAARGPAECCSGSCCNDCCGEAQRNRCEEGFPEATLLSFHGAGCLIHGNVRALSAVPAEYLFLSGTAFPTSRFPARPPARSPPPFATSASSSWHTRHSCVMIRTRYVIFG